MKHTVLQRLKEARRIAQPPETTGSISDISYRAVSIFPSLVLARLGISPNQITVLWIFLGLAGVIALGSPDYTARVLGALLLQFSYLLDFVDGEVARLQNRISKRGYFLDLAGHGLVKAGLFLALGYHLLDSSRGYEYLLLAFSACVSISNGHALPFYASHARVHDRPTATRAKTRKATVGMLKKLLALVALLFESPGLFAAVFAGAVLDSLALVVLFYGLLGPVWFLYRARKYRYE